MPSTWRDELPLKVANVLTYIFLLGSSIWSSSVGTISHGKDVYVTPANYVEYIGNVIHALLFGFVIFQFTDEGNSGAKAIGWRFVLLGILNAIFVHVFAHSHYIVGFIFSLLVAAIVTQIFYSLKYTDSISRSLFNNLFIHLPFSLWHAYSYFIVIHSLFVAFGKSTHQHAGVGTQVAVIIALFFLASTAWGYTVADKGRGDVAGAIVLAIILWGIYDHIRHPKSIHIAALVAFILVLLSILGAFGWGVHSHRRGGIRLGDERAPLVG